MRRADRLFDIIQTLRVAAGPLTAAALAEKLEVTARTIYRDVAALQASRVPIEGAAGIGYVLRRGFDLPPLMFTPVEIDAIAVGARHVRRLRDPQLQKAVTAINTERTAFSGSRAPAPCSVSVRMSRNRPAGIGHRTSNKSATTAFPYDLVESENPSVRSHKQVLGRRRVGQLQADRDAPIETDPIHCR